MCVGLSSIEYVRMKKYGEALEFKCLACSEPQAIVGIVQRNCNTTQGPRPPPPRNFPCAVTLPVPLLSSSPMDGNGPNAVMSPMIISPIDSLSTAFGNVLQVHVSTLLHTFFR